MHTLQHPVFTRRNLAIAALFFFLMSFDTNGFAENTCSLPDTLSGSHSSDNNSVVLLFGGDCLLAGHYEDAAGDSANLAFEGFDVLSSADVAMVNLECPITTRGTRIEKPYNFRMKPRYVKALTSAGIDIVNLANNHIYDYGDIGLFDTISYLDSVGILHVGAGRNKARAHAPVVRSVRGIRIAFLGYYGGGEAPKATSRRAGVADRDIEGIASDVAGARKESGADYVVVSLHWGTELADAPDPGQIQFAHNVIDAGANLVIGHHPHVLQGIERYKSGIIVYSLGNFLFGGNGRDSYDTALFEVRLQGGDTTYDVIPIRIEQWHVTKPAEAEGLKVVHRIEELSGIFPESIFSNKEVR